MTRSQVYCTSRLVQVSCSRFFTVCHWHKGAKRILFLADRTFGRAFGTLCRLSVCRLSVKFCIVTKRYVLAENCLKERIGK